VKILVISDTHGNVNRALKAYALSQPVDAIVHLGDGYADAGLLRDALDVPVINVAGNCDPFSDVPREVIWEYDGKRILLTHGDMYQVKSGVAKLRKRAEEIGVDAVLYGHTHQAFSENNRDLLMINPGALANHSICRSYAVLNITKDGITARHYEID